MSLLPRDRLATVCRGADRSTVTGFVAALYAARGYDVERSGEGLLRLDPGGRTVAVCPAGGSVPPEADAVVTAAGGIDPGDADVVDTGTLHEQLHYAVDRGVARDLLATHFDVRVEESAGATGGTDTGDSAASGEHGADPDRQRPPTGRVASRLDRVAGGWRADGRTVALAAVVGVLLFALFAVSGVAEIPLDEGSDPGEPSIGSTPAPTQLPETDTATPTPAPATADGGSTLSGGDSAPSGEASLPAGVGPDGIEDASALVAAHRAGLLNTSFTVTVQYREFVDGKLAGVYVETIRVENDSRYSADVSRVGSLETTPRAVVGTDLFVAGDRRYVGNKTSGPYFRNRATPSRFRRQIGQYLRWSLTVTESSVEPYQLAGEARTVRLTTTGDPYPGVENASGTAYVTADGLVTYGRWVYTTPEDPDRRVEFSIQTSRIGATTADRPASLDEG